jgi:hypothetical protein
VAVEAAAETERRARDDAERAGRALAAAAQRALRAEDRAARAGERAEQADRAAAEGRASAERLAAQLADVHATRTWRAATAWWRLRDGVRRRARGR